MEETSPTEQMLLRRGIILRRCVKRHLVTKPGPGNDLLLRTDTASLASLLAGVFKAAKD